MAKVKKNLAREKPMKKKKQQLVVMYFSRHVHTHKHNHYHAKGKASKPIDVRKPKATGPMTKMPRAKTEPKTLKQKEAAKKLLRPKF